MRLSAFNPTRNVAARMGRWSASHRTTAIFGWLAFVLASTAIGTMVGQKTIDQNNNNVGPTRSLRRSPQSPRPIRRPTSARPA